MIINRNTWNQQIHLWISRLPLGEFDLNDLLSSALNGMRPQAHAGRYLYEDVRAGLLPNVKWINKGANKQNVYLKT